MPEINPQLLSLFAQTNAIVEPVRHWNDNTNVAGIFERRQQFYKHGLPCPVAGGDGANRVAANERANRLERSGVVRYSRHGGKRTHWKLSQAEYLRIGFWCLLDGLEHTELAMRAIAANWERGAVACPDKSSRSAPVSEAILSGCDACSDQKQRSRLVNRLAEMLGPALAFGWVSSWGDTAGRVAYHLTGPGWETLRSFPKFDEPEYESNFACQTADTYHIELARECDALQSLKGQGNHVVIPGRPISTPGIEPCPPILDHDAKPIWDWEA